jgi:hypothetical protein
MALALFVLEHEVRPAHAVETDTALALGFQVRICVCV